jgi:transmembrane sensor
MQKINAKELLEKFQAGQCTIEEIALLESWYNQLESSVSTKLPEAEWMEDIAAIQQRLEPVSDGPARVINWSRLLAVASVVLIVFSFGGYLLLRSRLENRIAQHTPHDIAPGGNRAVLTLASGRQLNLSGAANGRLALQGNMEVTKTAQGRLVYQPDAGNQAKAGMNTVTTPRGGQYHVTLSDGTQAWLNAASSLSYPVEFTGNQRRVEITGEVYFEVAHNAAKPFLVMSRGQQIEVLGTHFNINTYTDEPGTRTTLLEGSVCINGKAILKPGQQALLKGAAISINETDTEQAVAWKNNKFMFDHEDISGIMRMVARWYDVEVIYSGGITQEKFTGSVSRFTNASKVLGILQDAGQVHFKVEGRRITVSK